MRIMLVNDDGYRADGIRTLARALAGAGHRVTICAPDTERSGASHSFSFGRSITARAFDEDGLKGYAISGTPADCAALGLQLMDGDIDLVISGINHGTNLGGACIYSGTVGSAMEASMLGYPAFSVSIGDFDGQYRFADCAQVLIKALDWLLARPLARGEVYNINIPNTPYAEVKGFKKASLTTELKCNSSFTKVKLPDGSDAYMTRFGGFSDSADLGSDHMLLKASWATVTPLTWNIIAPKEMDEPEIML